MQSTPFRFSVDLTATLTTNLLNPGTITGGVNMGAGNVRILLTHLRAVNRNGSPRTLSLWIGASGANAAGTEFWAQGKNVPANDFIPWYGRRMLKVADFLVGGASAATSVTLEGEGEYWIE